MKRIIIPIFLVMLFGCATMTAERELNRMANRAPKMDAQEIQAVNTEVLIRAYRWHPQKSENVKLELTRRKLIDFSWWPLIEKSKIRIGMTKEAVRLSWGDPWRIHRTAGRWGIHEQWVYDRFPHAQYLYFENGLVTGWQD